MPTKPTKKLRVVPNPYIALDKDGVPQGVVSIPGSPTSYIGAQLDTVLSKRIGRDRFYFPLGIARDAQGAVIRNEDGTKKTGDGSFEVLFHADLATSVRAGELLAADEASAALCGITKKDYLPPAAIMAVEKAKALRYYASVLGVEPDSTTDDRGKPLPIDSLRYSIEGEALKLEDIPREPAVWEPEDEMTERARAQITPTMKVTIAEDAPVSEEN